MPESGDLGKLDDAPPAPQDVRMAYADGTEIPLDLRYAGLTPDGVHQWEVVGPVTNLVPLPAGASIRIGVLPGRTGLFLGGDGDG